MNTGKAAVAEFFGTFWLVFGGTGAAVLAASVGNSGIGWLGVSLAFGLTVVTMAYAVGHISGAHFNPAITIGLWAGGRFPGGKVADLHRRPGDRRHLRERRAVRDRQRQGRLQPVRRLRRQRLRRPLAGRLLLTAAIVIEILLTLVFVLVIHGVTDRRAPVGLAPLAIGLTLTLIHLISIPVTNTSVNPARSLAPALFVGGWALSQLWVFIVFPIVGGIVGGLAYRYLLEVHGRPARQGRGAGRSDGGRARLTRLGLRAGAPVAPPQAAAPAPRPSAMLVAVSGAWRRLAKEARCRYCWLSTPRPTGARDRTTPSASRTRSRCATSTSRSS